MIKNNFLNDYLLFYFNNTKGINMLLTCCAICKFCKFGYCEFHEKDIEDETDYCDKFIKQGEEY